MENSNQVVKPKPPTDFSEFHQQEVMRRLREEQENETEWDRRMKELDRKEMEKKKAAEEEDARVLEEAVQEQIAQILYGENDRQIDDGTDVEEVTNMCRAHIGKRLELLRAEKEDLMTKDEIEALPQYDRERIEFIAEHDWDLKETVKDVRNFICSRIEHSPFNDVVIGYRTLVKMYDPILLPDLYFLSLYHGSPELVEHERWSLFGY